MHGSAFTGRGDTLKMHITVFYRNPDFKASLRANCWKFSPERLTDPCLNSEAPPMDRLTEGRKTISIVFYNTFSEKENIIPDKSTETNY
mgnify:FL=1